MEERVDKKDGVLKAVFWGLVVCVVILLVAVIVTASTRGGEIVPSEVEREEEEIVITEEERLQQDIENEAYSLYLENDGNIDVAIEFYDSYINGTDVINEKVQYLENKVGFLNVFCGMDCRERILADINAISELDAAAANTVVFCELKSLYSEEEEMPKECERVMEEENEKEE